MASSLLAGGLSSLSGDITEAPPPPTANDRRRGGRITTPFITATVFGLTVAAGSWSANLIVFLINEFNVKRIDAAQISSVVNGCVNFFPLVAAVLADSLLGCFSLIWISSLISLLGLLLLLLTVTVETLKPPPSQPASGAQYAVLYSAMALTSIGLGGTRFTLATMGADQLEEKKHQSTFFNWYFFSFYSASVLSSTIVYVEDNVGWRWGFAIGMAANAAGLALFFAGSRYYRHDERPRAAPFAGLLGVAVAAFRKREAAISCGGAADYYYGDEGAKGGDAAAPPTDWFRALNRAALKFDGDILPNGSVAAPWKLSTVQQVEDLKSLIRVLPLWSSSIFLGTPIGVQLSLTVLQSLASDRHISSHFQFPASSIIVFTFLSTAAGVVLIDRCFRPAWRRATSGKSLTPLQQVGIGHLLTVASMAVSALVESRRRGSGGSMPVAWLVPQMVVVGVGEAFHFPGQVELYYREFPACLKSLSTAMVAMLVGVAYYLSTAVVDFVRRVTNWLPDDIDKGRVDNVYWVMVVIGAVNFGYFLLISWFYEYKNGDDGDDDDEA